LPLLQRKEKGKKSVNALANGENENKRNNNSSKKEGELKKT